MTTSNVATRHNFNFGVLQNRWKGFYFSNLFLAKMNIIVILFYLCFSCCFHWVLVLCFCPSFFLGFYCYGTMVVLVFYLFSICFWYKETWKKVKIFYFDWQVQVGVEDEVTLVLNGNMEEQMQVDVDVWKTFGANVNIIEVEL